MRTPNEALSFTGHETFIIPHLYMKLETQLGPAAGDAGNHF